MDQTKSKGVFENSKSLTYVKYKTLTSPKSRDEYSKTELKTNTYDPINQIN